MDRRGRTGGVRRALALLVATAALGAACVGPPSGPGGEADLRPLTGFTNGSVLSGLDLTQTAYVMNAMRATGAEWVRIDLSWARVQAGGRDSWNWSVPDQLIGAAVARGFHVLAMPAYTPGWARPAGTTSHTPPTDPADFARFAAEAARRYAPLGVAWWQIWNEPNNWLFWEPGPDPVAYAELLRQASAAIKAEIPGATVVTAGFSPGTDAPPFTYSPWTFLQRLYDAGARDTFDAVAIHPYSFPRWPLTPSPYNTFYNTPQLYDVMVANGDGAKKVWATEVGFPTGTYPGAATYEDQATIITHIVWGWFARPWAGPLFLSTYIDYEEDPSLAFGNMGLVDTDGVAKPSLAAWIDAITPVQATTTTTTAPPETTTTTAPPETTTTTAPPETTTTTAPPPETTTTTSVPG